MEILTKAIFYDEDKQKDIEADFTFNIYDIEYANEGENKYTVITFKSTGTKITIKIKFDTYWNLIEKNNLKCLKIVE